MTPFFRRSLILMLFSLSLSKQKCLFIDNEGIFTYFKTVRPSLQEISGAEHLFQPALGGANSVLVCTHNSYPGNAVQGQRGLVLFHALGQRFAQGSGCQQFLLLHLGSNRPMGTNNRTDNAVGGSRGNDVLQNGYCLSELVFCYPHPLGHPARHP